MDKNNFHYFKKVSKPFILSFSYILLGSLIKLLIDIYLDKKVGVDAFTFPIFLILLLLIIISLVHFILKEKDNFENISDELKTNIRFRCDIIVDMNERYQKMIKRIRNAEKNIFIFSNLPGRNEKQNEVDEDKRFHVDFLNELNKKFQKGKIEIVRIITPDNTVNCKNKDSVRSYFNNIIKNPRYKDHFELLEKDSNLLGLLSAPRGISILFIDSKYLFFIIEDKYSEDKENTRLARQLKNGFYFEEYNSESSILESTFGQCFKQMQKKAKEIKEFL